MGHCLTACPFSCGNCISRPSLNHGFWIPLCYLQIFYRYQVCTTCLSKENELCLNNSEYIAIYIQYTNKYMCKLNFYKCWKICVDHCQLLATVYKVKMEIKQTRLNLATLYICSRSQTKLQNAHYLTWFDEIGVAIIKRNDRNTTNSIQVRKWSLNACVRVLCPIVQERF